jgi:hypothetical protein
VRRLAELASARAGDKGDVSNVAVVARDQAAWEHLRRHLTADRVAAHFGDWVTGPVEVHPLPRLLAFNVVMRGALGGGATRTLRMDNLGKAMGAALLRLELPDPEP